MCVMNGARNRELGDMSTQFRNSVIDAGREARGDGFRLNRLVKIGLQGFHLLVGFGFLILAVTEFIRNPPYFDVVGHNNETTIPPHAFFVSCHIRQYQFKIIMVCFAECNKRFERSKFQNYSKSFFY